MLFGLHIQFTQWLYDSSGPFSNGGRPEHLKAAMDAVFEALRANRRPKGLVPEVGALGAPTAICLIMLDIVTPNYATLCPKICLASLFNVPVEKI